MIGEPGVASLVEFVGDVELPRHQRFADEGEIARLVTIEHGRDRQHIARGAMDHQRLTTRPRVRGTCTSSDSAYDQLEMPGRNSLRHSWPMRAKRRACDARSAAVTAARLA